MVTYAGKPGPKMQNHEVIRKFLFDCENNKIVGDCENAYKLYDGLLWKDQLNVSSVKYLAALGFAKAQRLKSCLDIGCGYGAFVDMCNRNQLEAKGYDISITAIQRGKEQYGFQNIQVGTVSEAAKDALKYDMVCLFGMLWYVLDNVECFIDDLDQCMHSSSYVYLTLAFPKKGIFPRGVKTPGDLTALMIEMGFKVISSSTCILPNEDTEAVLILRRSA